MQNVNNKSASYMPGFVLGEVLWGENDSAKFGINDWLGSLVGQGQISH